jgi:hypothetical protein
LLLYILSPDNKNYEIKSKERFLIYKENNFFTMNLKVNINRIHSDLLQNFEEVQINEKASLQFGEYVELNAKNENKEIVIIVEKRQLEMDRFVWSYYSNPSTKDFLVERVSTVDSLIEDVKDIFVKNRFDEAYLNEINK